MISELVGSGFYIYREGKDKHSYEKAKNVHSLISWKTHCDILHFTRIIYILLQSYVFQLCTHWYKKCLFRERWEGRIMKSKENRRLHINILCYIKNIKNLCFTLSVNFKLNSIHRRKPQEYKKLAWLDNYRILFFP